MSYPRVKPPWIVERTHASVCPPETTSSPTPALARIASRSVSSKESPYFFSTIASPGAGWSSSTICHCGLLGKLLGLMADPDDGRAGLARTFDERGDPGDDGVAVMCFGEDAALDVDHDERFVAAFKGGHDAPSLLPVCAHGTTGVGHPQGGWACRSEEARGTMKA